MRALCLHEIGGGLTVETMPDPDTAEPGQVAVDIAFASVNPLDIWVATGNVGTAATQLPWVPGTEAVGFLDGKPVLVRGSGLGVTRPGLCRQCAVVDADTVHPVPVDLDLAHVAAVGVAGITAWNALHTKARVEASDRVLVLGASGGVGCAAVQLAKATGAVVWGQTGSAAKVGGIHADQVVVAANGPELLDAVREFRPTVVLDGLGGEFTAASIEALDLHGRLVVYGTSADERVTHNLRTFYRKGLTMYGYTNIVEPVSRQHAVLEQLFVAVRSGALHIPYELVPLEGSTDVHGRLVRREVEGKLVIDCR